VKTTLHLAHARLADVVTVWPTSAASHPSTDEYPGAEAASSRQNLVGVNFVALRKVRDRRLLPQRFQRNPRLQPSVNPPSRLPSSSFAPCAGCHGSGGQGIPHVVVPLATNSSLRLASALSLIHAVLNGIPAPHFPGLERMQPMPNFKEQLTDQQVVDLVNWLRATWGGRESHVTLDEGRQVRRGG
jgi:hypothetical protein